MNKIETVIIDDEPRAIELMMHFTSQIKQLKVTNTFRDSLKAFHYLNKEQTELIFIDINMPNLSGIDLIKTLNYKSNFIFTTAHEHYAVEGFNLEAIDYLLKPITFPRFLKAYQKLESRNVFSNVKSNFPSDPIYIKSGNTTNKFLWRDILYLEKSENYIIYHLSSGKRIISRQTLSNAEKMFPQYIVRIHRGFAICLYSLSSFGTNHVQIGDIKLPIGRNYKAKAIEKIDSFR